MGRALMILLFGALGLLISLGLVAPALSAPPKISDVQVNEIRESFKNAKLPKREDLRSKEQWNCTLYGMRSRKQVKRQLGLYRFKSPDSSVTGRGSDDIGNAGGQLIKTYRLSQGRLEGARGPLKDIIRQTSDGALIAELSIPKRDETNSLTAPVSRNDLPSLVESDRVVVSYAVCRDF